MSLRHLLDSNEEQPVYIIAEVGVNHNGSFDRAIACIDEAVRCGADAVKFQTFKSEKLVARQAEKAAYQTENTGSTETQLEMLKKLELGFEDFIKLKEYCQKRGIDFLSTPFDEESAEFLHSIGLDAFKIGSGDMNNIPFLKKIGSYKRPVLLSTGMADLKEIGESIEALEGCPIILLHCTSDYPAPLEDVNLKAIHTMQKHFCRPVGYSDHTMGLEVTMAAVAMGACVIEKHFTLDRKLEGPDHKASLEPDELAQMVRFIRNIEKAMGNGIKRCMPSEESTRKVARKSVMTSHPKRKGETLTLEDLVIKRPGTGLAPKHLYDLVGRKLLRDLKEEQLLSWEDVE